MIKRFIQTLILSCKVYAVHVRPGDVIVVKTNDLRGAANLAQRIRDTHILPKDVSLMVTSDIIDLVAIQKLPEEFKTKLRKALS